MEKFSDKEQDSFGSWALTVLKNGLSEMRDWLTQEQIRRGTDVIESATAALWPNHTSAEPSDSTRVRGKGVHRVSYSTETENDVTRDVFWVIKSKKNGSMHTFEETIVILEDGRLNLDEVAAFRYNSPNADPIDMKLDDKEKSRMLHELARELQDPNVIADLATDVPRLPLTMRRTA